MISIKKSLPINFQDNPWKQVVTAFLRQLMELLFPAIAEEIDWSKPYRSLEQELLKLFPDSAESTRIVDKLFEVSLKSGETHLMFMHLEIQSQEEADFPARMAKYYTRLIDRLGPNIFSVAILLDNNPNWRPGSYSYERWHCSFKVVYPIIKIIDFLPRIEALRCDQNPFAWIILIYLQKRESKSAEPQRLLLKKELGTLLIRSKKFETETVRLLMRFLDWMLILPKELEHDYLETIETMMKEEKTMFIPGWLQDSFDEGLAVGMKSGLEKGIEKGIERGVERGMMAGMERGIAEGVIQGMEKGIVTGMKQGRQEGLKEGEVKLLQRQLQLKFEFIPMTFLQKIETADERHRTIWSERILIASTLEEVFEEI